MPPSTRSGPGGGQAGRKAPECWATRKRARGGNASMTLVPVKGGGSPSGGRLERVERLHHTMAAEVGESRQGDEGKPGVAGTERGNL